MIRKLLLPALLMGVLGGCVTGYEYRDGYYYGRPSVEYRYHDYGYGYYPPYGYYPYAGRYPHYYGYGGYPYYRYGYPYGYPNYYRPHYRPRPPVTYYPPRPDNPGARPPRDDRPPPWRDLGPRNSPRVVSPGTVIHPRQETYNPPRPEPRRNEGGSRMEQVIRRATPSRRSSDSADTHER